MHDRESPPRVPIEIFANTTQLCIRHSDHKFVERAGELLRYDFFCLEHFPLKLVDARKEVLYHDYFPQIP